MKAFRYAAMVAAVMLAVTTSSASACAGGGWRILHLEWLCCWIWGNNHKGCKADEHRYKWRTFGKGSGPKLGLGTLFLMANQALYAP